MTDPAASGGDHAMDEDSDGPVRRSPVAARGLRSLDRAFRSTTYRAGQAGGRVGRRAPALEALLRGWGAREAAFLTAWNPWGRPRGDAANARAHARLLGETRRLRRATGWCGTREWRELTLLLAADPRRIATLARRHRQAAVVHLRLGCALRLAYSPRFASKPRPAAR